MLCLYVQAPFAVFRAFTAGSFRPTAEFMTHSAAYGLLLNLVGIEMRQVDDGKQMTLIRSGLPKARLALGAISFPSIHTIYQQLHNYPVGASAKEHASATKGSKYNIVPVRRAFLSDLRAYVCFNGNDDLEKRVRDGLQGESPRTYGLPFLGDNNFLIDRLEVVNSPREAYWYVKVAENSGDGLKDRVTRLTTHIDRARMENTRSHLFAPTDQPAADIPKEAWVEVGY